MEQLDPPFGTINPNAPAALSRFAFLVGRWRCAAKLRVADSDWQSFHGIWVGRYILDGYAIQDEYRMFGPSGVLIVLGTNFRSFEPATGAWNIKWLDALTGQWTNLTSEEFGGVQFEGASITYVFREPVAAHAFTRATYTNISGTHFTWCGEKSSDGEAWAEFMVVEVDRSAD